MKVLAKQPLFQFGVLAYKGQEVEVSDKLGKELVESGFATEIKAEKKQGRKAKTEKQVINVMGAKLESLAPYFEAI